MPAQLVALTEGPNILLDKPIMLFGRNPECDIQIDSRKISRRHCCIAQVNDYLVVRDLGSTNGIRINGARTLEGKLQSGDELTIGNHRYQVRWDAVADLPSRPVPAAEPSQRVTVAADDDEVLEECDEPVALPEPGNAPKSARPSAGSTAAAGEPYSDVSGGPIIPNLELSPPEGIDRPSKKS